MDSAPRTSGRWRPWHQHAAQGQQSATPPVHPVKCEAIFIRAHLTAVVAPSKGALAVNPWRRHVACNTGCARN